MIRRFLIAVQFLTRLPLSRSLNSSESDIAKASAFFPLVGIIVGGATALVLVALQKILPLSASVLCAVIFAAFLTNGFHEDGLADSFDGFGGGWTKDRVLEIMRDSRIGTYGSLALIFLIFGKVMFLSALPPGQIWRWLIIGHTAARWTTLPLCVWLPYARVEGQGKLVAKQVGVLEVIIGTVTLLAVFAILPWQAALAASLVTIIIALISGLYYRRRIHGITGDCLGATNQLTEIGLYLTALILLRFNLVR